MRYTPSSVLTGSLIRSIWWTWQTGSGKPASSPTAIIRRVPSSHRLLSSGPSVRGSSRRVNGRRSTSVSLLRTHKKSLMQNLFPREGETVPRLRFPEFRNAPGWEQRPLGSEALFFKGRGVSKADVDPNGSRPCIRYGELYTRYGEVIDTVHSRTSAPEAALFLSSKNDVIIPASGETKEDIATASCVMLDGIALGGDINVLRTNHNGVFLSYLINGVHRRAIAKVAQGDTVVHLYPSQLAQVPVMLPETPEQKKIAECLTSLDALITAQAKKLDTLKLHKQGLMQGLFPSSEET